MGLTDFFIDYIPMYNKFRAVSSILVIAEFTIPLLAIFALKEILSKPDILKLKENRTGVIVTLVLTAGVALILAIAPGVFFSTSVQDRNGCFEARASGGTSCSCHDQPERYA